MYISDLMFLTVNLEAPQLFEAIISDQITLLISSSQHGFQLA